MEILIDGHAPAGCKPTNLNEPYWTGFNKLFTASLNNHHSSAGTVTSNFRITKHQDRNEIALPKLLSEFTRR